MSAAAWKGFAVMSTAYRQVLLSAWQANRNRSSLWFLALVGLPALASGPISLWWSFRKLPFTVSVPVNAIVFMAMPFAAIVLVWAWAKLVSNVLLQNHPHMARLLPAQVPVLRNTLLSTAALLCAVSTLLSWLAGGPVLAIAAGMALGLALLTLFLRWPWLWLVVAPLGFSLPLLNIGGHLEPAISLWHTAPEVLTVLTLMLAPLALRAVVMTGDARHKRAHARMKLMSAAMRGQVPGTPAQSLGGLAGWLSKRGNSAYAAWMGHLLAQERPKVGARLALGLGPQAHWTTLVTGLAQGLLMLALACVVLAVLPVFPDWKLGQSLALGALMVLAGSGLTAVAQRLPAALWASRREQALLCLLPGVPRGASLNRWLAWRLAGTGLANLALLLVVVLVLGRFANATTDAIGGMVSEMALSMLVLDAPMVFLLWRDWARAQAPAGGAQGLTAGVMTFVGWLALAWAIWLDRHWYELAALTLLLTLPLAWWRWRVISRAPTAWPVGRLGQASAGSALALFKSAQ